MTAPIYSTDYLCYSNNEYIGIATFTDDPFIGDSFQLMVVHKNRGIQELTIMPDYWVKVTSDTAG